MKKKIIISALILLSLILIYATGLNQYLTFENLQKNKATMSELVKHHYTGSAAAFILIYIASVALSIPGATLLTLIGGFLFGKWIGTLYVNIGATSGAMLAFLLSRYLLGETLQQKYDKQLKTMNDELEKNGVWYMLSLRLIPVFPFFLINLLAGLTRISLRDFFLTTAIGILPASFVYTYAGHALGTIHSLKDVLSRETVIAFTLLGVLSLIPIVINKLKKNKL